MKLDSQVVVVGGKTAVGVGGHLGIAFQQRES
jgi:hypothetical protein